MEFEKQMFTKEMLAFVGMSASWVYAKIRAGEFPPPRKLGERKNYWLQSELEAARAVWAANRVKVRNLVRPASTPRVLPHLANGVGYQPIEGTYRAHFVRFGCFGGCAGLSLQFELQFTELPGRPIGRFNIDMYSRVLRAFIADLQRIGLFRFEYIDLEGVPAIVTFANSHIVRMGLHRPRGG
jgi:predicted DNA-binding transcriptional regulator AlpA